MLRPSHSALAILSILPLLALAPGLAGGAEFAVENRVYDNGGNLLGTTTTMFSGGVAYDFLADDSEITVYDAIRRRFMLLHSGLSLRSELTLDEVRTFADRLRAEAKGSSSEMVRFLADPQFESSQDPATNQLLFKSRWIEYRVNAEPPRDAELVREYSDFAYWTTQLNSRLNPSAGSSFTRLAVQRALESRQLMPTRVEVVRNPGMPAAGSRTLRSEHRLQPRLVASDRRRIAEAKELIATLDVVPLDQYLQRVQEARELAAEQEDE